MLIRSLGVGMVVVKHGAEGCLVSSRGERFTSPRFSIKMLDTTGSEDTFEGDFVLATLEGGGLRLLPH
jgi:sugar/nucleoside kinase (ribokinase family)